MTLHISPDTAWAGATASHSRARPRSQQHSVRQEPPADQVAQGCLNLGADVVGLDGSQHRDGRHDLADRQLTIRGTQTAAPPTETGTDRPSPRPDAESAAPDPGCPARSGVPRARPRRASAPCPTAPGRAGRSAPTTRRAHAGRAHRGTGRRRACRPRLPRPRRACAAPRNPCRSRPCPRDGNPPATTCRARS